MDALLAYYSAETMDLRRLKNEVCEQDADICRICECLGACALGKRYIREVEAGRLKENPKDIPFDQLPKPRHITLRSKVRRILAEKADGVAEELLYRKYGYCNRKSMRRAISRYYELEAREAI